MLLHLLINTLIVGSGYALVAMAFRLMNSVSPFFNMTIGAVAVLGGYTAYWLLGLGFPFWLVVTISLAVSAAFSGALKRSFTTFSRFGGKTRRSGR